jgi:hypothetical protein
MYGLNKDPGESDLSKNLTTTVVNTITIVHEYIIPDYAKYTILQGTHVTTTVGDDDYTQYTDIDYCVIKTTKDKSKEFQQGIGGHPFYMIEALQIVCGDIHHHLNNIPNTHVAKVTLQAINEQIAQIK